MSHNIVPVLSVLAMALTFLFVMWRFHRMKKKSPDLKEVATASLWIYPLFCIILFIPAVAMVHDGSHTWQNLATGMPLFFFYPFSLLCILGPYYELMKQSTDKK